MSYTYIRTEPGLWTVGFSLDDALGYANPARGTVTLTQIINRARAALDASEGTE